MSFDTATRRTGLVLCVWELVRAVLTRAETAVRLASRAEALAGVLAMLGVSESWDGVVMTGL